MQIMSGQGAIGYVSLSPPTPAPAPLTLSLQGDSSADGTVLVDEEPDSPTYPGSCTISPEGYTPLTRTFSFAEYGPCSVNGELCYNAKSSTCTAACPDMDELIRPIQDGGPLIISDDLECDMYPPDYSVDPGLLFAKLPSLQKSHCDVITMIQAPR